MTSVLTVLFNGVAYGMLLFIMSVGLSVTMGMMNFVNLAQASFSMLGGYIMVAVTQKLGIPFLASLPIAFVVVGIASLVIERLIFRHFYGTDDLTHVLLTIGLIFMSIAIVTYFWGSTYQQVSVPSWLTGQQEVLGFTLERYRMFLVAVGGALAFVLVFGLERTRFGAIVRACVDNNRVARACGLNTELVFALTFAIGGGGGGVRGAPSGHLARHHSKFSAALLGVSADCRFGRRHGYDQRNADRRLGAGDRRRCLQILRAADRGIRDLCDHGRGHAVATAWPVGAPRMSSLSGHAPRLPG